MNRTYTREDINAISTRVDRDVWKYKGGWYTNPDTGKTTPYCRHEWVQQITIKRPAVAITEPGQPLVEVGEVKINTIKEGREFAKKIIEEALGIKAKLAVDSEMTVDNFKTRLQELKKLFGEYEINSPTEDEINLRFTSGKTSLGFVKRNIKRAIQGFTSKIVTINVGSKTDPEAKDSRRAFLTQTGRLQLTEGNKVDPKNLEKLVVTHEFAHVISTYEASIYNNNTKMLKYWDDLKNINKQYNKEVLDLLKSKDVEGLNKIYIGKYADTNIDEFHAESFMEYKLSANPTKYAKLVGELIDKNFKK